MVKTSNFVFTPIPLFQTTKKKNPSYLRSLSLRFNQNNVNFKELTIQYSIALVHFSLQYIDVRKLSRIVTMEL